MVISPLENDWEREKEREEGAGRCAVTLLYSSQELLQVQ